MSSESLPTEALRTVELRAHHLFTLLQLHTLGAHRSATQELLARTFKRGQFRVMGHANSRAFADHMTDSMLAILKDPELQITLTNTRDEVCKACPQRREGYCYVIGRKYSNGFLSEVDDAVIRNSESVLENSRTYPSEYFTRNKAAIRRALYKTFLELRRVGRTDDKTHLPLNPQQ